MATDAQILTAARNLADAIASLKAAELAEAEAKRKADAASTRKTELHMRAKEAERSLLALSQQKPAEPAPKVEPPPDRPLTLTVTPSLASPERPPLPRGESGTAPPKGPVPVLSGPKRLKS